MSNVSLLVVLLGFVVLATPSTSRQLNNGPELSPVEQLYVEAQAVIDTLKEEAIKHHLAPLSSEGWEGKAAEIQEEVKNYIDEVLSPSGSLGIVDNEVKKFFDAGLPPSEMLDMDEKPQKYGDFAPSPLDKMGAEEKEPIDELEEKFSGSALSPSGGVENQDENSLAPSTTEKFDVDQEAENYHISTLSPSDRLEEKAVEMLDEVQDTNSTTP